MSSMTYKDKKCKTDYHVIKNVKTTCHRKNIEV